MSCPKQNPPKDIRELADRILHYGKFAEGYQFLMDLMQSKDSTTVIIRGNIGSGKRTLVESVMKDVKDATVIYIEPSHCTDDYSTLRDIAQDLNLKSKPSLQDLMEDIEKKSIKSKNKIVLVLIDFEEFCRQKQSLLYSLTNIIQNGNNISLVGLTVSLDCTEKLEKRVRSRLNALFYELSPPYTNETEYVEFASHLLGTYALGDKLVAQLKYNFLHGNRSLRQLKRFLITICTWNDRRSLILLDPKVGISTGGQSEAQALSDRLRWLTKNQLELLKLAVYYCFDKNCLDFTVDDLYSLASKHNYPSFSCSLRDVAYLDKTCFIRMNKPNQIIDQHSTFTINVTPTFFKHVIKSNTEFHSLKTDQFWKRLR